jgi:hypothetical protein
MKIGSAKRFFHKFQDVTVNFTDLKISALGILHRNPLGTLHRRPEFQIINTNCYKITVTDII